VLYLGDHDPSGVFMDKILMRHMTYFEARVGSVADWLVFRRLAILPEQIEEFNLPTRPVKKSDSRAKNWDGDCVEIDTLSGKQIRAILEENIVRYIDKSEWERTKAIEQAERETLEKLNSRYRRQSARGR
jgi:hypothetical protein